MEEKKQGMKEKKKQGTKEKNKQGIKKNFNRKTYLKQNLKTNFGSQQEGHGRAFLKKKATVRQYFRQQRREEEKHRKKQEYQQRATGSSGVPKKLEAVSELRLNPDTDEEDSAFSQGFQKKKKLSRMQRARLEYHQKRAEKEQKKEEAVKRRQDKEEAKKKYKEKRLERYKKLNQKTRKGQPVMSGKIELMLQQLQKGST